MIHRDCETVRIGEGEREREGRKREGRKREAKRRKGEG